jgi:hypothetical protein
MKGCLVRPSGNPVEIAGDVQGNFERVHYPERICVGGNGKVHLDGGHQVLLSVGENRAV